jgi:hypothetical protein
VGAGILEQDRVGAHLPGGPEQGRGDGQGGRRRRIRGAIESESRVKRLGPQIQKPRRTTCPGAALLLQYGASELRGVFVPCLLARGLVLPFVVELLRLVLSALIRRCEKRSFFILLTMRPATLL